MEEQPDRKKVKVGVQVGGGSPPGYRWSVVLLTRAIDEAMDFLSRDQYAHLAAQFRELAKEDEPTGCPTVDIRPIEDFYELRDKGGILGRLNVRVFFFMVHRSRSIVVLGAIKKENEGQTSTAIKTLMRYRKRGYLQSQVPDP